MAKVSGRHEQSGRDLVFEQWFEDNIVRVKGGALTQLSILKAYRNGVHGPKLGEQGVARMLNTLKVPQKVQAGKRMRLGVGFKSDVRTAAVDLPPPNVTLRAKGSPAVVLGDPSRPASVALAVANAPKEVFSAAMSIACEIAEERIRQQAAVKDGGEGFDIAHDDASDPGAHERAAATYAFAAGQADHHAAFVDVNMKRPRAMGTLGWMVRDMIVVMWPWAIGWWKPKTDEPDWKRRCLVRAGALIIAAIERIDRAKARASLEAAQAKDMTGV